MSVNALELLFRKLQTQHAKATDDEPSRPYTILLQHSLAASLRMQAAEQADETVYRRAGLRTPSENARRDLEGGVLWTKYMTQLLVEQNSNVFILKTSPRRSSTWMQQQSLNVHVIDATANDLFGWLNEEQGSDSADSLNLQDLNSIVSAIESRVKTLEESSNTPCSSSLVIDPLTPILQIHGIDQTIRFLQRLQRIQSLTTIVVPVNRETLSPSDHLWLEHTAQAILSVEHGDVTLLRQGVRERDNVVRETLAFEIVTDSSGQRAIEMLASSQSGKSKQAESVAVSKSDTQQTKSKQKSKAARPKIELCLEEDVAANNEKRSVPDAETSTPQPRIYMDDDDPEFDDYDEEDPDDDLDI
ncbi:hypothetical protein MPSEU_000974400 [Mayamaea pseudoterrestris]|nr:hypothetical protein MPSEU_000974400 [Mayamaea pseudoterrestris]